MYWCTYVYILMYWCTYIYILNVLMYIYLYPNVLMYTYLYPNVLMYIYLHPNVLMYIYLHPIVLMYTYFIFLFFDSKKNISVEIALSIWLQWKNKEINTCWFCFILIFANFFYLRPETVFTTGNCIYGRKPYLRPETVILGIRFFVTKHIYIIW